MGKKSAMSTAVNIAFKNGMNKAFVSYLAERHSLDRRKKQHLPQEQWTQDPLLKEYRFGQVFLDLEPCNVYAQKRIISQLPQDPTNALLNITIYRRFNQAHTMEHVINNIGLQTVADFNSIAFNKLMKNYEAQCVANNIKIFNSGHVIPPFSGYYPETEHQWKQTLNVDKLNKVDLTSIWLEHFAKNCEELMHQMIKNENPEKSEKIIQSHLGIGPYFALLIMRDLVYSEAFPYYIYDHDKFTGIGPGAQKGVDLLLERNGANYFDAIKWLRDDQENWFRNVNVNIDESLEGRRLTLVDIEHNLCYFKKFMNPKQSKLQRYVPRNI